MFFEIFSKNKKFLLFFKSFFRQCISYQLSTLANFDSKLLFSSIKTYNSLVVQHFAKNAQQSDNESRLLYELGLYLENCGLSEPVNQVSYKGCTFLKNP